MSSLPDLDSLKLLVDVGELGSLGRAAKVAGIAQPSASKRIAQLERRLGLSLLERTPRGSTLTNEGKVVAAGRRTWSRPPRSSCGPPRRCATAAPPTCGWRRA